ncbi:hypothetical protein Acor_29420 [Acrocarpospora corrugata]|uniref:Uncharacterized protein n=1 Tax=Acrocarpospora corrugata TaxID=35763 RepID=A0A5M3W2Q2_9ACTN|nr:hypothetical protein Acor_29420 [Acrocarpospora corrugata]
MSPSDEPGAGEADLEERIRDILEEGGERGERLRTELAGVLAEIGAVGAAVQAAVEAGGRDLQTALATGLEELGTRFGEFGFVLADLRAELRSIQAGMDEQGAHLLRVIADLEISVGLQYRQAADSRLLLDQVAALRDRGTPPAGSAGSRWTGGSPYGDSCRSGRRTPRCSTGGSSSPPGSWPRWRNVRASRGRWSSPARPGWASRRCRGRG